ncbi:ABC transporter, partial [Vibrio parahaemolyticus]
YTLREVTDTVDGMYLPLSYLNIWAGLGKWALEGLEKRALLVPQEAQLDSSPDPYVLTRDVYIQRQNFKAEIDTVEEVNPEEEALLDEYLDEF